MNPGAIAREGYLYGVLSIAVSGYLTIPAVIPPEPPDTPTESSNLVVGFTDNYEICAVSGFRALPGTLVYDEYTREKVLPEFADPADTTPRRFGSTDTKRGALRPEQDDTFIDTPVEPDDF